MTVEILPSKSLILFATATILIGYISSQISLTTVKKHSVLSVKTSCGEVLGKISKTSRSTDILEFFNIPYAAPPVGQLRFRSPEVYNKDQPWGSTINGAEQTKIVCPQPSPVDGSAIGTEDCLYLTIRTTNLAATKPVIVWIHGGRFIHGFCCKQGYSFDRDLTETLDAVTVNINYRLGFLGFSSVAELWDEEAGIYANNGIRDQIAALQWIRDNIPHFGGDPDAVTIIGESAGGTSVLALVSSPLARGLFHQAVALSPGPEQRFDHVRGDIFQKKTWRVLENVGCDKADDIKKCLLNVPAYNLVQKEGQSLKHQGKLSPSRLAYFGFPRSQGEAQDIGGYIIIDPIVFPQNVRKLGKAKNLDPGYKIKIILSNTAQETYVSVINKPHLAMNSYKILNHTLSTLFKQITDDDDILQKVYDMYGNLTPQFLWDTLKTDMRSTCPTNDVAEAMSASEHHEVYRLFIDYNMAPPGQAPVPAYHCFDTDALFGYVGFEMSKLTPRDWEFRKVLINMLREFSRGGKFTEDWKTFPAATMILRNEEKIVKITGVRPHERNCYELQNLNLTKYGWQN